MAKARPDSDQARSRPDRADRPLDGAEEAAWRALARAMVRLPRILESELEAEHRLTMSEYFVLVNLSEAPDRSLRMSDLAERAAVSLSGMSRVVDRLARQGLAERHKCEMDGRGTFAVLTDAGLARLKAAYPSHLRSVRRHVIDHLRPEDLEAFAAAVNAFAE